MKLVTSSLRYFNVVSHTSYTRPGRGRRQNRFSRARVLRITTVLHLENNTYFVALADTKCCSKILPKFSSSSRPIFSPRMDRLDVQSPICALVHQSTLAWRWQMADDHLYIQMAIGRHRPNRTVPGRMQRCPRALF